MASTITTARPAEVLGLAGATNAAVLVDAVDLVQRAAGGAERARRAVEAEHEAEDEAEADLARPRTRSRPSATCSTASTRLLGRARVAQVLDRVGDERLLAEQPEQRDRRRAAPGTAT